MRFKPSDIRDLVGRILVAGFHGSDVNDHARRLVRDNKIRNIILFGRNVESLEQVRQLTQDLRSTALHPLLICTDQENGVVRRIAPDLPGLPGNMAIAATGKPELAYKVGSVTAKVLGWAGIDINLAPVLDINTNPRNPVIGVRSYGDDPQIVGEYGRQMILGLQDHGTMACAKHFPGHGDTSVDSHLALPVTQQSRERLERIELIPFLTAIEAGVKMVMSAHIVLPSIEPTFMPATLSFRVLTELLRGQLGYQGVILTDCLEMDAISKTMGVGEAAVQALHAGADMIMVSHRLEAQVEAADSIVQAVMDRRLSLQRLEQAAMRTEKLHRSSHQVRQRHLTATTADGLRLQASTLQREVCPRAVTVVRNLHHVIPLRKQDVSNIVVLLDEHMQPMQASDNGYSTNLFVRLLCEQFPSQTIQSFVIPERKMEAMEEIETAGAVGAVEAELRGDLPFIKAQATAADVVLACLNGLANNNYLKLVQEFIDDGVNIVIVALQNPYDFTALQGDKTSLAIYEYTPWMVKAGIETLFGAPAYGTLPVHFHV